MTKTRHGTQRTVTGAYSADKADSGKDRIRNLELDDGNASPTQGGVRNIAAWVEGRDENNAPSAPIRPTKGVTQKR